MRAVPAVAAVCLSLLTSGCRDVPPVSAPLSTGSTALRIINAGSSPVDLVVDGRITLRNVGPAAVSERLAVSAGHHAIRLVPANQGMAGASMDVDVASGRTLTAIAMPSVEGGVRAEVLADTGAAPVAGKSKLRVVHLATHAPPLDVWRTQPDYMTPIQVMFPFPVGAQSSYLVSDPGTWEVWVTRAGQPSTVLSSSGPVVIGGSEVRTIALVNAPAGGIEMLSLDDR
jgi:hypothetical protein